ncbi:DEAD/DEAH box helicase [Halobacteriovorax sp. RT-2-6]|uniref:DEAD/DEAH box helicase n=1 Tax=unclassified Halobacteriovorax TaxID=2639665 RepID=UPI00399C0444
MMQKSDSDILSNLLKKCNFDELRTALGEEIVNLTEYLTDDVTISDIVKVGISAYGTNLLFDPKVRFIIILNNLEQSEIEDLCRCFKVPISKNIPVMIYEVAHKPFKDNKGTIELLKLLGFSQDVLNTPIEAVDELSFTLEKDKSNVFYETLDYQYDIRRKVIKLFLEQEAARCLVHMPTGAGKTKTSMHILQELWSFNYAKRGDILWIAHSEELLNQALATFVNTWDVLGAFSVDVEKLWGAATIPEKKENPRIIFASIQKLQAILKKSESDFLKLTKDVNLLLVDECHKAPASKTHEVILKVLNTTNTYGRHPNLIGLTATPGRTNSYDIEDRKLKMLFDNVKFGISMDIIERYSPVNFEAENEIDLLQKREILSTFVREPIKLSATDLKLSPAEINSMKRSLEKEKEFSSEILHKLSINKERNRRIINKLIEVDSKGLKTIFFACNIAHAKLINAALKLSGIKSGLVLGETPPIERNRVIKKFQENNDELSILINVGVLTTGFDSPNIDCVFVGRPISSIILYSQIIGRGIRGRLMGGKQECLLIDVIDNENFGDEKWAFNYFDKYWS